MKPSHLFVYGTLRSDSGHPMHEVLAAQASLLGVATVRGTLRPVREHVALIARDDAATIVTGEIYEIQPVAVERLLQSLDAYEGIGDPAFDEYRRELVTATLGDGRVVRAWAYVLKQ